jgi:hypothetical protein
LWYSYPSNHSQEELAKFSYMSKRKIK